MMHNFFESANVPLELLELRDFALFTLISVYPIKPVNINISSLRQLFALPFFSGRVSSCDYFLSVAIEDA